MGPFINYGMGQYAWEEVKDFWSPLEGSTNFDLTVGGGSGRSICFTHPTELLAGHGITLDEFMCHLGVNNIWISLG